MCFWQINNHAWLLAVSMRRQYQILCIDYLYELIYREKHNVYIFKHFICNMYNSACIEQILKMYSDVCIIFTC